jgi:hypothetical protein
MQQCRSEVETQIGAHKRKAVEVPIAHAIRRGVLVPTVHADARRRLHSDLAHRSPRDISETWRKACFRRFRRLILIGLAAAMARPPPTSRWSDTISGRLRVPLRTRPLVRRRSGTGCGILDLERVAEPRGGVADAGEPFDSCRRSGSCAFRRLQSQSPMGG